MGDSVEDVRQAIAEIIAARRQAAQQSPYDWKVCVGAVSAADATFRSISMTGTPAEFLRTVINQLAALRDSYDDPDGEYTNGCSDIGSVVVALEGLERTA